MIRFRLVSGFVLLVLAGMVFTALRLGPEDELPRTPGLVLAAAIVGGLAQFGMAVGSVSAIHPLRLVHIGMAIHALVLSFVALPFVSALASLVEGAVSFGTVATVGVGTVIIIGLLVTFRQRSRS
ncbi:MAG: hypothetical protein NZ481_06500 [Candidatus Kapabacteria bacterium]|nr:hypothetical protein [Candidatus Kapabacteria bacterium]